MTLLNNQSNIHQKLNLDEPFEEFEKDLNPQVADPLSIYVRSMMSSR
jgi:hypothetical protein